MPKVTRSESVSVLRYGVRDGGDCMDLYEVGLRVDASKDAAIASVDDISRAIENMGHLRRYLRMHVEGRLLLSDNEPEACAFAAANPRRLPRGVLHFGQQVSAAALARVLVVDLVLPTVQVSFDSGDSYIAQSCGADGLMGSQAPSVDTFSEWTKASSKTKFMLVRRQDRASGADS